MSQSSLQVLLHAGELEIIVRAIEKSQKQNAKFVAGCLFGLWRNSLKQPVIQFVTGPPKGFEHCKDIAKMFKNQSIDDCARIIKKDHCLLHLGFWFCCSQQAQRERAEEIVFKSGSKYDVLLFIDFPRNSGTLTGEYLLKNDNVVERSELFKEDVLGGHSSFRLYGQLTDETMKFESSSHNDGRLGQDVSEPDRSSLVENLPSRVQVEEAVTHEDQWYSTDEGTMHLQLLFQYFSSDGIQPGMSRDAITHNIQFELSGGYFLDFPANFPRRMPVLRAADGRNTELPRGSSDDVCRFVVDTVVEHFRRQQSGGGGGGRGRSGGGRR